MITIKMRPWTRINTDKNTKNKLIRRVNSRLLVFLFVVISVQHMFSSVLYGEPPEQILTSAEQTYLNLVKNSSFEAWAGGAPRDWTQVESPTLAEVTSGQRLGAKSLEITCTAPTAPEGISQTISVEPNTTYSVGFYYKTVTGTMNFEITGNISGTLSDTNLGDTAWTFKSYNLITGATANSTVTLKWTTNTNGYKFQLDGIIFVRGAFAPGFTPALITDHGGQTIYGDLTITGSLSATNLTGSISASGTANDSFEIDTDDTSTTPTLTFGANASASPKITTQVGPLTIQPAAGSGVNIPLYTTGDFAVNTNQLYVDTSAGNVGIGTTVPAQKLHVEGQCVTGDTILPIIRKVEGGRWKVEGGRWKERENAKSIQKSKSLAEGNGVSETGLCDNQAISEGRAIWSYKSDETSGSFSAGEYCRRKGSLSQEGIHSIPVYGERFYIRNYDIDRNGSRTEIFSGDREQETAGTFKRDYSNAKWSNPSNPVAFHLPPSTFHLRPSTFDLLYVSIVNVKPGDYALSLNEETQKIEPHRINGLLDMGVKPVFKLTTASGRFIKTTGNHPYLVKLGSWEAGKLEIQPSSNIQPYSYTQSSCEWRKVCELNVGNEIAVPKNDLFGPDTDTVRFDNKEPGLEFFGADMLEKIYRPLQNFFPGHSFNINYNYPVRFPDFKADNISKILIKGEQDAGSFEGMGKDFSVCGALQPCLQGCFDLNMQAPQRLNNVSIHAMVNKDFHNKSGVSKNFYRLFAQLRSEFYGSDDVFFSDTRVLHGDFINGIAGSQEIQDISDGYTGAFYAGFAKTHIGINRNSIFKVFGGHVCNLLVNKIYHSFSYMSSLMVPDAYASLIMEGDILWDKIVSIEYIGYEHVYDIEVEGTHNFVTGHWIEKEAGKLESWKAGNPAFQQYPALQQHSDSPVAPALQPHVFFGGIIAHNTYIKGATADNAAAALSAVNSSGASLMYIRNDGSVGIGTTNPVQKLHVEGQCVTGDTKLSIFEQEFKVQGSRKLL